MAGSYGRCVTDHGRLPVPEDARQPGLACRPCASSSPAEPATSAPTPSSSSSPPATTSSSSTTSPTPSRRSSTGSRRSAGRHLPVHAFDLRDADKTEHLFAHEQIDAVIHFAGLKAVGESVEKPLEYYENNLGSTFSLVRAMQRHGVRTAGLLLARPRSTASTPRCRSARTCRRSAHQPVRLDQGDDRADPARRRRAPSPRWRIALLRYFNPVGAHPSGTHRRGPRRASRTTSCRSSRRWRSAGARS